MSPRCRRSLTHSKWGACPKTPSRAFPAPGAAEHGAAGLVSAKFQVFRSPQGLGPGRVTPAAAAGLLPSRCWGAEQESRGASLQMP